MNAATGISDRAASIIYLLVLIWPLLCLTYLHWRGKVNLISAILTTKDGKEIVDNRKLCYIGTFAVMATAFAYLALTDRFTEWYALIFVGTFVTGKALGDREQRLNRANELKAQAEKALRK